MQEEQLCFAFALSLFAFDGVELVLTILPFLVVGLKEVVLLKDVLFTLFLSKLRLHGGMNEER